MNIHHDAPTGENPDPKTDSACHWQVAEIQMTNREWFREHLRLENDNKVQKAVRGEIGSIYCVYAIKTLQGFLSAGKG